MTSGRLGEAVRLRTAVADASLHLCLGFLFTHELDAMPNHEWRLLPLLRSLADETAVVVFVAAHVPLFAALIALVASEHQRVRDLSRLGIAGFVVMHGLIHALSIGEPAYEFSSTLSNVLIFGGALCGGVHVTTRALQFAST